MVVDATEKFLHRMANVIVNMDPSTTTPSELEGRFGRHKDVDVKKARLYAARARKEKLKRSK